MNVNMDGAALKTMKVGQVTATMTLCHSLSVGSTTLSERTFRVVGSEKDPCVKQYNAALQQQMEDASHVEVWAHDPADDALRLHEFDVEFTRVPDKKFKNLSGGGAGK